MRTEQAYLICDSFFRAQLFHNKLQSSNVDLVLEWTAFGQFRLFFYRKMGNSLELESSIRIKAEMHKRQLKKSLNQRGGDQTFTLISAASILKSLIIR